MLAASDTAMVLATWKFAFHDFALRQIHQAAASVPLMIHQHKVDYHNYYPVNYSVNDSK